jgi:hypothetical protein
MPENKAPVNPPAAGAPECRYKWIGTCGGPVTHWCEDCHSGVTGLAGYYCQRHAERHAGGSHLAVAIPALHYHISTACLHSMHQGCRKQCKFCDALCACPCHATAALPAQPDEQEKE